MLQLSPEAAERLRPQPVTVMTSDAQPPSNGYAPMPQVAPAAAPATAPAAVVEAGDGPSAERGRRDSRRDGRPPADDGALPRDRRRDHAGVSRYALGARRGARGFPAHRQRRRVRARRGTRRPPRVRPGRGPVPPRPHARTDGVPHRPRPLRSSAHAARDEPRDPRRGRGVPCSRPNRDGDAGRARAPLARVGGGAADARAARTAPRRPPRARSRSRRAPHGRGRRGGGEPGGRGGRPARRRLRGAAPRDRPGPQRGAAVALRAGPALRRGDVPW